MVCSENTAALIASYIAQGQLHLNPNPPSPPLPIVYNIYYVTNNMYSTRSVKHHPKHTVPIQPLPPPQTPLPPPPHGYFSEKNVFLFNLLNHIV